MPNADPQNEPVANRGLSESGVFSGIIDAYRADGFDAGYRRAVNDMLAEFALLAKEVMREHAAETGPVREALRTFQNRFEKQLLAQADPKAHTPNQSEMLDGGLGI